MFKTRLLSHKDLQERGIKWTRQHLHRQIRAGKFPKPVKIGSNTNGWVETEIDEYIARRIAARDQVAA